MNNGNYIHEPTQDIRGLIQEFLQYDPQKKAPLSDEPDLYSNASQK